MIDLKYLSIPLPEDISHLAAYGDYDGTIRAVGIWLKKDIPSSLRRRLELERIRIDRLRGEYVYGFEEALGAIQKRIEGIDRRELQMLKDEGFADWAFVGGEVKFHERFVDNIIKTYPGAHGRLIDDDSDSRGRALLDDAVEEIISNGSLDYYIRIRAGIRLKSPSPGKTVRAYVPIPASCRQIGNIRLIETNPAAKYISPERYPQRTAYFEGRISGKDEFTVEYSYENRVKYVDIDYDIASDTEPEFDCGEIPPHIAFTPYLRELAGEIVGDERNPLKKARRIYNFITTKVRYSFVREYSTIPNIPEYAASNLKGDCGVQALLFITLCRIERIPARWQSGLYVTPYSIGCHDWAEFYVRPYGWMFADPSFGGSAYRGGNKRRWEFYFGNIDPFRMVANSAFQYDLTPEKKFFRSDPYDNQRGEAEYEDRGIYYDGLEPIMDVIDVHRI